MVDETSSARSGLQSRRVIPVAVFVVLFAGLTWTYWTQTWPATTQATNGIAVASKTVHLDGTYYYAFLRSLILDRDLDFTNDYELLGNPLGASTIEQTKRPGNLFTIGPALLWTPFFLVGHLLSGLSGWGPPNGAGERLQMFVFFGSCIYGFAACVLAYLTAALAYRRTDSFLAAIAALFGTPLYWHMMRQASYSHAISAFLTALLVLVWARGFGSLRSLRWLTLGILFGLGMSVRVAALAHAIVPAAELAPGLFGSLLRRDIPAARKKAIAGLAFTAGAVLGFLPQMLAWKSIYGSYLTIPQGSGFMVWSGSRFGAVLFSAWNGWAAWHPLVSLGLLGLAVASIRVSLPIAIRTLARAALLVIAAEAFLNGAAGDWYAGFAFGGRRFTDCSVYVALGVAQIFALLGDRELTVFLSRILRNAIPAVTAASFAYFSFFLSERHILLEVPIWGPVDLAGTWKAAVTSGMDRVYALTGNWGSIPQNWWFASSGNVSPARYDTADARAEFPTQASVWAFKDTGVSLGGFGETARYLGRECRWLSGREGRIAFLLRIPKDLHARISLASLMPGLRVRLSLDGQTLLETELGIAINTFEFDIPRVRLTSGTNFVRVEQLFPTTVEREIGKTGTKLAHDVTARSAGWGLGNAASLVVDGKSLPAGARGIGLFEIDADDGTASLIGTFDTSASPTAAENFAKAVSALRRGTIAALAVADDASFNFSAQADEAIRSLGGAQSLRGAYRASYALLGVKGAAPGTALESFATGRVVDVTLGRRPSQAVRGSLWHELHLEPKDP